MLRTVPVDLSRYLPKFLFEDETFQKLLSACSTEHEKQRLFLQELGKQLFVETATWGLSDWERIVDIAPKPSDTYDERRRRVLLKLQSHQTSTLAFMEQLISRYLDAGRGYIEEHPERYAFRVMLEGCLIDKPGLIEALETYKPAHLGYDFRFLLIGDTLREDFAATQYGDDNAITDLVARLRYHLEDAYLYESFDDPPRHGDEGLYHDGLHMRVGADGPTIDRVSVGLSTYFEDDLQSISFPRGDGIERGTELLHGKNVYPHDSGLTISVRYQGVRGYLCRDGVLARGSTMYHGDHAETILDSRRRHGDTFPRGTGFIRGGA